MSPLSDKKRMRSPMTATVQSTFRICGNDDKEKVSDATRIGEDHKGGSVLTIQFFHPLQSNGGKWQGTASELRSARHMAVKNGIDQKLRWNITWNLVGIYGWNRLFHRKIKRVRS